MAAPTTTDDAHNDDEDEDTDGNGDDGQGDRGDETAQSVADEDAMRPGLVARQWRGQLIISRGCSV